MTFVVPFFPVPVNQTKLTLAAATQTFDENILLSTDEHCFNLQSGSNGMLWPGCGQAQLCPKVLTAADEPIPVNLCNLHAGSSAQLWNG